MLERDIENAVVNWAMKRGFLAPKVKFVENGWPDRLFVSPYGHTIFIEFKRPGFKPEPIQHYRILELNKRGIPAYFVDSIAGGIEILQAALDTKEIPEASNSAPVGTGVRRSLSRSGPRQDVDGPRYDQDPVAEKAHEAHTNSGPAEVLLQGLARRDREVGGIPPPTVDGAPWDPEGS